MQDAHNKNNAARTDPCSMTSAQRRTRREDSEQQRLSAATTCSSSSGQTHQQCTRTLRQPVALSRTDLTLA